MRVNTVISINNALNAFAWGPVMLAFFIITGAYLSFKTGFVQLKLGLVFKRTLGSLFIGRERRGGALTPFQAMTTALAGTVGTGNISGVALAMFAGGAGAVFWMWVSAFLGMCTKYAEIVLAVRYRVIDPDGTRRGGAMYYIERGLGERWRWLAVCFAALGCAASFGIGNMAQSSEIAGAAHELWGADSAVTGALIALTVGLIVIGGIRRIGTVTSYLVPAMSVFYLLAGLFIVIVRAGDVPAMLMRIVREAFSLRSAGGGILGCGLMRAMKQGFARGIFSNEAGLGSAPIAHAASSADEPCEQALWGVFEVFADTVVICTITAFAMLLSGVLDAPDGASGYASGGAAAAAAFDALIPGGFGGRIIRLSLILFALSSIVCWSYYGESCLDYLSGGSVAVRTAYRLVFVLFCFFGATGSGTLMWDISDTLNGLMAIPNLIALALLGGTAARLTREYFERQGA